MRWSKLRQLVKSRFADSLKARLDIHSTAYGACSCGHAWITLDDKIIANFCTRAHYIALGMEPGTPRDGSMYKLAGYGEFSRQDAYAACWAFVHDLSSEQALSDGDPLVQTLAVLDRRVGKRRLMSLDRERLHPLAHHLADFRMSCEGLAGRAAVQPDPDIRAA